MFIRQTTNPSLAKLNYIAVLVKQGEVASKCSRHPDECLHLMIFVVAEVLVQPQMSLDIWTSEHVFIRADTWPVCQFQRLVTTPTADNTRTEEGPFNFRSFLVQGSLDVYSMHLYDIINLLLFINFHHSSVSLFKSIPIKRAGVIKGPKTGIFGDQQKDWYLFYDYFFCSVTRRRDNDTECPKVFNTMILYWLGQTDLRVLLLLTTCQPTLKPSPSPPPTPKKTCVRRQPKAQTTIHPPKKITHMKKRKEGKWQEEMNKKIKNIHKNKKMENYPYLNK